MLQTVKVTEAIEYKYFSKTKLVSLEEDEFQLVLELQISKSENQARDNLIKKN